MKTILLSLGCLFALSFSSCSKEEKAEGVFKAKLIASFCAYNIVEIQDKNYFNLGMTWTSPSGTVYNNVFTVSNYCDFNAKGIKVNELFDCRILEKETQDGCGICYGYMETPPLNRNIEVVK
ncbi:hypothetical protein PDL71_05700 [Lacibacter sp. MH-610]|uniref:hypothetical protein n=1 Tax=Lacibacter sp. MH-610 TaxID=3020883 RepID=UPI0038919E49